MISDVYYCQGEPCTQMVQINRKLLIYNHVFPRPTDWKNNKFYREVVYTDALTKMSKPPWSKTLYSEKSKNKAIVSD